MAVEILSAQGSETIPKRLLLEQLRAFRRFVLTIEGKVRRDCALRNMRYKGWISWPEAIRSWRRKKQRALIAFAREHKLCRKDIKEAVVKLKAEESIADA